MDIKKLLVSIATLGPIGYVRGSGSLATLVTLPFVYAMYDRLPWPVTAVLAVVLFVVAVLAVRRALRHFDREWDPSEIVMDEVIGCFITFYGIPLSIPTIVIGFILFRFFDIVKPFGIARLEKLPGVLGVILDDVFAGILSNIALYFIHYYFLA